MLVKNFFGLVKMTFGLVDVGYSLPEGQAVKLIFFAPCIGSTELLFVVCLKEKSMI